MSQPKCVFQGLGETCHLEISSEQSMFTSDLAEINRHLSPHSSAKAGGTDPLLGARRCHAGHPSGGFVRKEAKLAGFCPSSRSLSPGLGAGRAPDSESVPAASGSGQPRAPLRPELTPLAAGTSEPLRIRRKSARSGRK
ncbi:hypothetical protein NDU88_000310 [Pleurodeles waltl]|uniref:Uncharacterized protein n=1 Tax=Pleurodeles waltl TaxID=8319 RepID=A0AAV7S7T4_PLEWA|nr:hypothetical protein NDU88_000310 [Pleurodeles waltl]